MSRTAAYIGTFDPLTLGHLDIIRRARALVDRLVIGVSTNSGKSPLFALERRVAAVRREVPEAEVEPFAGLAVDFAARVGASFIVRGLRTGTDLDYERQMAAMNGTMAPAIDTLFLVAAPALSGIASSLVKDVARGGGNYAAFVPAGVAADIAALALGRAER